MSTKREQKANIITEREKFIYNTYLRVHRTKQNKPFRYRKQFDDFQDNENYIHVKKLGAFFKKFSHIEPEVFFNAPYNLYPDDNSIYDLKFYASQRAVKVYGLYTKQLDQQGPDTDYQLQFVKDSLMFIFKFCRDNKLTLTEYINHKTGDIPTFVLHLRNRYVSIYSLFGVDGAESKLFKVPKERLDFTIGENFTILLEKRRTSYYNSTKNRQITNKGIKQIKELLLTANNG